VQPPGRGSRFGEQPFTRLNELVVATTSALTPFMDIPFAFFGYTILGFELARLLRRLDVDGPKHRFVAASRAPRLAGEHVITYNLPDRRFVEELRRLAGTPVEVLENEELLHLMLPLLRADFAVAQTYSYADGPPLDCPLTAFGGLQDEGVKRESVAPWGEYTTASFSLHMLPGDHFFLHTSQGALLEIVARELEDASARRS
jgi:medium-chain acyl-[acyl-carrier-protein] hydrolase